MNILSITLSILLVITLLLLIMVSMQRLIFSYTESQDIEAGREDDLLLEQPILFDELGSEKAYDESGSETIVIPINTNQRNLKDRLRDRLKGRKNGRRVKLDVDDERDELSKRIEKVISIAKGLIEVQSKDDEEVDEDDLGLAYLVLKRHNEGKRITPEQIAEFYIFAKLGKNLVTKQKQTISPRLDGVPKRIRYRDINLSSDDDQEARFRPKRKHRRGRSSVNGNRIIDLNTNNDSNDNSSGGDYTGRSSPYVEVQPGQDRYIEVEPRINKYINLNLLSEPNSDDRDSIIPEKRWVKRPKIVRDSWTMTERTYKKAKNDSANDNKDSKTKSKDNDPSQKSDKTGQKDGTESKKRKSSLKSNSKESKTTLKGGAIGGKKGKTAKSAGKKARKGKKKQ